CSRNSSSTTSPSHGDAAGPHRVARVRGGSGRFSHLAGAPRPPFRPVGPRAPRRRRAGALRCARRRRGRRVARPRRGRVEGAAALGTAVLALAFGLALLYLASERQMKSKRPGRLFARLPSLDLIDRAGYRLAVWGFVFLSLAIATGSFVSREATGTTLPFAPKQGFALLAWALFASLIQARLVAGWRGRRVALLVVTGFVLLAGVYVGLLSAAPALHGATAATFLCVGISHREAAIDVREQLAVPTGELAARLLKLKSLPGVREAALLSTCNRLEIYAV